MWSSAASQIGLLTPVQPGSFAWKIPQIGESDNSGDPNSIENSTTTQTAAGVISFDLKGGLTYDFTDPGDGLWWTWRAKDVFGQNFDMGDAVQLLSLIEHGTDFADTDDAWIVAGFANENDLNTGTVDGLFAGVKYTGSATVCRVGYLLNGADTVTDDATNLSISYTQGTFSRAGGSYVSKVSAGLDSNGDFQSSGLANNSSVLAITGDAYFFISVGRTAATAGAVTGDYTPRYLVGAAPVGGRTP